MVSGNVNGIPCKLFFARARRSWIVSLVSVFDKSHVGRLTGQPELVALPCAAPAHNRGAARKVCMREMRFNLMIFSFLTKRPVLPLFQLTIKLGRVHMLGAPLPSLPNQQTRLLH